MRTNVDIELVGTCSSYETIDGKDGVAGLSRVTIMKEGSETIGYVIGIASVHVPQAVNDEKLPDPARIIADGIERTVLRGIADGTLRLLVGSEEEAVRAARNRAQAWVRKLAKEKAGRG